MHKIFGGSGGEGEGWHTRRSAILAKGEGLRSTTSGVASGGGGGNLATPDNILLMTLRGNEEKEGNGRKDTIVVMRELTCALLLPPE